ncbi:GTPase IMAP family member 4-like [Centropristis striata]|uniref:GTPase IMAP family member 4-like n=1 Tax=Centropristis striata TaxID=184440 RepID=UPI0027E0BF9B|nr:GTPase IMAP family member 4-like [Centropristis striata]
MMGLSSAEDSHGSLEVSHLRMVLLGKTGSGKSSTGNTILGRKAFTSEMSASSVTETCERQTGHFDGRSVSVVDTPGVFDTVMKDEQLKREIEKCLQLSAPGPHIFLLVVRLDVRFTQEEQKTVMWITDNFGEEASEYTLVLFTRGDELKDKSVETYLKKSPEFKKFIRDCTSGYIVFDNTRMENRTQVADLFEMIDKKVELNGNYYTRIMFEEAQKKMKSKEWWSKWGGFMRTAGTQVAVTAAAAGVAAAAPAAAAALVAEEAAATSLTSTLTFAAGWITKGLRRGM